MTVKDLHRKQLIELKQNYLCTLNGNHGVHEGVSYNELANADELVSDEEIFEVFEGTEFSPDDFSMSSREVDYEQFVKDLEEIRKDTSKMVQYVTIDGEEYEDDCSNYTLGMHTTYFDDFEIEFLALSYVVNTPQEGDTGYGGAKCLEGWTDEMIWAEITQHSDKVYYLD